MSSASCPALSTGIAMQANEQQGACQGLLAMKHSWPSTLRTIYGDHERYEVTYFAGFKVGLASG